MSYTGPHVRTTLSDGFARIQHSYRTVPGAPRKVLPYFVSETYSGSGYWGFNTVDGVHSLGAARANALISEGVLYDKFHSRLGAKAESLMNLFQAKQTWEMVSLRAAQLLQAARYVSRGRIASALDTLGVSRRHPRYTPLVKKWKGNTKQTSRVWLEATFGWAPVASDMLSTVKIFEQEFNTRIKVRVRDFVHSLKDDEYSIEQPDGTRLWFGQVYSIAMSISAYAGSDVRITNPNAFLANRLGLVNLGSVLWDAIPFSFVLDWFGRFGSYIRSLTDEVGVTFDNGYKGWSVKGNGIVRHNSDSRATRSARVSSGGRTLGLPPRPLPFDRLRIPEFSPWLVITSVALLVTTLKGFK